MAKWTAHGNIVRSLVFTRDGKGLVSSSGDGTWKYWDIDLLEMNMTKDRTAGRKIKVMADTVRPSHVPVPPFLLTQVVFYPSATQNDISSIAISPDGQWVVSASADHAVRIWDLRNGALQCTLSGHKVRVWSVDFYPTGNYLASGSEDGRVALWRYEAA